MKKYLLILVIFFISGNIIDTSFADTWGGGGDCADGYSRQGDGGCVKNPTTVIVTEKIPGGNCVCAIGDESACTNNLSGRKYTCEVSTGLTGFQTVFAEIIRYFIYIVLLLGVLGIVGLGIAWAFAGGDDIKAKSSLKTWGVNIIIGLTILFLFSYILRFLAPWVYQ